MLNIAEPARQVSDINATRGPALVRASGEHEALDCLDEMIMEFAGLVAFAGIWDMGPGASVPLWLLEGRRWGIGGIPSFVQKVYS
jgi:hypothetical protein